MDLRVVAAAAGAGYLGKYLKNLSLSEKERLLVSSSAISTHRSSEIWNFLQQARDRTCPLRRLAQEKAYEEVFSEQKHVLDKNQFGGDPDSIFKRPSTSAKVRMVEDFSAQWLKSSPPKFCGKESFLQNMEYSCRFCSNKLLKSRYSGKANLEKVEERAHISLAAQPITGGSQVLESFNHNSFDLWSNVGENPLREIPSHNSFDVGSEDILRISNCNSFDSWSNVGDDIQMRNASSDERCTCFSLSSANNMDNVGLQEHVTGSQEMVIDGAFRSSGRSYDMLLFLIGLMIGTLPTSAANKREVQKMNEKLDQAMNLVQDLKEELDMKDNITVKELVSDGPQPLNTETPSLFNQELFLSGSEQEPKNTNSSVRKLADYDKAENSQLMSTIEAELEAELARLEHYMDLERKSDFVELDSESEVNKIGGGIKLDAFRRRYDSASESELDEGSDSMTRRIETPPANYAVSPRELSIRLHEVIESRLEARVEELETALQIIQNRFPALESQCNTSLGLEYDNGESPAIPESHVQGSGNATDTVEEVRGEMTEGQETNTCSIQP